MPISELLRGLTMMRQAGIVLAAGASSRMGFPKALLQTPDGVPLAVRQLQLLQRAGCEQAFLVLGSEAERIQQGLALYFHSVIDNRHSAMGCEFVINTDWPAGRFGSVMMGLQAAREADGVLIMPVDTVGVHVTTLQTLLKHAADFKAPALRPVYDSKPGKILWLSKAIADQLLSIHSEQREFRLDQWISDKAVPWPTDDAAILNNVNTPEEWKQVLGPSRGELKT
jgi:CTP:molybdopterin cytidylyltransferase MocA